MTRITNLSRNGVDLTLGSKNGEPILDHIEAGETKNVEIDAENSQIQALVLAGQIAIGKPAAKNTAKPFTPANRVPASEVKDDDKTS